MIEKQISEDTEQMYFVQYFRREFKDVRILAIPNGGARHPAVAMKLKLGGVSAGVPDLCIPAWHLWIEMKKLKGGILSKDQKSWIEYLEGCGDSVIVGRGCEDAKRQVLLFLQDRNNKLAQH